VTGVAGDRGIIRDPFSCHGKVVFTLFLNLMENGFWPCVAGFVNSLSFGGLNSFV